MLPAGLGYPSGFGHHSNGANIGTQNHGHSQLPPMTGLDALAQGSQYALQQLHKSSNHQPSNGHVRNHHDSYSNDDTQGQVGPDQSTEQQAGKAASGPARRRISRACDQCNQLRTKCDGRTPCAHCVEFGLTCEYNRQRRKRGKASRKDLAQQQATVSAPSNKGANDSPKSGSDQTADDAVQTPADGSNHTPSLKRRRSSDHQPRAPPPPPHSRTQSMSSQRGKNGAGSTHALPPILHNGDIINQGVGSVGSRDRMPGIHFPKDQSAGLPPPRMLNTGGMPERGITSGTFSGSIDDYHRHALQHNGQDILHGSTTGLSHPLGPPASILPYSDSPYNLQSPQSQSGLNAFRIGESPIAAGHPAFLNASPNAGSPGWLQLPSPSAVLYPGIQQPQNGPVLRFPVLRPILPRISAIIPVSLACDLLELYFSSSYSKFIQPASPYVLGFIFRKRSFLRPDNPRPCSPALLASILWVAAQTSESSFLTSPPSARGKICQKLLELTVSLLRPLIHTPAEGMTNQGGNTVINGLALGGFGVALHTATHENEGGSTGATGAVDDVATYINLATVVSASEYKAASLRWWNAAWSLARELKLGRELPPDPEPHMQDSGEDAIVDGNGEMNMGPDYGARGRIHTHSNMAQTGIFPEEEREERRRIWWLLYIVDRHLALCYNRPLFLLDAECDGLLQPEDDTVYQAGDNYPPEDRPEDYFRRRGPSFECTGHSIFGYFLPLMTILGEIVDLNHTRNHPRFGVRFRNGSDLDDMANEISHQLEAYGRSLEAFEARFIPAEQGSGEGGAVETGASPSNLSNSTSGPRITEVVLLTRIIVAYGTHLMHTLHILLNGKWDPISLLDDNDLWISSQSFISATGHAVSAAEAISGILDYDPDLSFMPFFFGIYLLQGSFLLLLIADKLQGEASPSVVKACEQIVRAHEVCVVTLNTEYQRNFRKVMRSALQQVRGRTIEDFGEQQQRRREVLALYRWTGDGSGLAL